MNDTYPNSTATFDVDTTADLLGMSPSTVRRWASQGKLELVWETANRPWFTVTGMARVLAERQCGALYMPLGSAAFGNTIADSEEAFAVRLSLFANLRRRVALDRDGRPLGELYEPDAAEYDYHMSRITEETNKAGLI